MDEERGKGTHNSVLTYDLWGKLISVTPASSSSDPKGILTKNPFRYRGYYYDNETGYYYLNARYYDPQVRRFISADDMAYLGADGTITGYNLFVYCVNNPINRTDSEGNVSIINILIIVTIVVGVVCIASYMAPLAHKPDLDVNKANPRKYNCYGNAIKKRVRTNPTGYQPGDSTRKTFEAVRNDLGADNVRELTSIDDPIEEDEYKVAMKCGPWDYHFIRCTDQGWWYNKSGLTHGLYVTKDEVVADIWYARYLDSHGREIVDRSTYYDDETIYFAIKKGWDN